MRHPVNLWCAGNLGVLIPVIAILVKRMSPMNGVDFTEKPCSSRLKKLFRNGEAKVDDAQHEKFRKYLSSLLVVRYRWYWYRHTEGYHTGRYFI
jgi:hypothetical protein